MAWVVFMGASEQSTSLDCLSCVHSEVTQLFEYKNPSGEVKQMMHEWRLKFHFQRE